MYDHAALDWLVPAEEWQRFRDYVEREFGAIDGYLGRQAEAAMREYADEDDYNSIEEKIDRLVEAAGRRPSATSKEKKSELASQETTRVTVKVEAEVKDKFRAVAADSENTFGVEFARAIRTYRDGGRAARVERKLDRVLDDAAGLLAELTDSNADESLSHVERKTIAVANELPQEFKDDHLVETIEEVAGVSSEPSIKKYRERVTERLDVEPHPNVSDLWIPSETAEEMAPGQPRECRQPADRLDREDRIRRIQYAIGRAAATRSSGRARADATEIRDQVLNQSVTKTTTLELMRDAAKQHGFEIDEKNTVSLKVNLQTLAEEQSGFYEAIIEYRDETEAGLLSGPMSSTMQDYTTDVADDASATMQQLGEAVPDGGHTGDEA